MQAPEEAACEKFFTLAEKHEKVVHGWSHEGKSKTACGLSWIYGRHQQGKKPLEMSRTFSKEGITCKRCLLSKNLRVEE